MNKKVIGIIIGLMSAALIGIVWSQMNVILTSIRTNEEKFNDNVQEALYEVATEIEEDERFSEFEGTQSGFSLNYYRGKMGGNNQSILTVAQKLNSIKLVDNASKEAFFEQFLSGPYDELFCKDCRKRRSLFTSRKHNDHPGVSQRPLGERVSPSVLKQMLSNELAARGINMPFDFGVYAKESKSWIIVNDHYVINEEKSIDRIPGTEQTNKPSKPYQTILFPQSFPEPSPGYLMVQFPSKLSFIWRNLWLNLLGTILFATIILGCFAYTVNIIFKQKRVSMMKTDFINNMTHEFKTPIATISLAADSITSPMISGSPEKIKRFAGIIKQENKRMNNQVEKVLQMALIDKQEFSLKLTSINLNDIITTAVENIGLQVEKRNGTAVADLKADNPVIEGDATHIANIINNLLDNANKYSPENPEIMVQTKEASNGVKVIISDKGVGMSKEDKKQIFDKFYRVHTGNLHDVKGFGLGLSYVKAIMDAHKGQVDVKSELGKGSSFILFFPRVADKKSRLSMT